jgi:indolepyruvate ferredoxin oxidoreductase, alpha subunit
MNVLTAPGKRLFLTGDEAVARAALEVGVHVVTGYPGNPGTKAITALIPIARQYGITVEWSVNEKVALEVATGAAWAGKRSMVTMKMSGINAMADSLLSIAHSGVKGPLVIYAVDDVGTYYGMVEQDSRHYALLSSLPLLMPASPEEAYSMTRLAFSVSKQTGAPIFLLGTTAVANAITAMKVGKIERDEVECPASFERNLPKFTKAVPQWCRDQHADALTRLEEAGKLFEQAKINFVPTTNAAGATFRVARRGIIVSGVSYAYLQEVQARSPELFTDAAIFKLGSVHPLPTQALSDFLAPLETVLVLEELDPIIETNILALIAENGLLTRVIGKRNDLLPQVGDYSVELVDMAMRKLAGKEDRQDGRNAQVTASAGMQSLAPMNGKQNGKDVQNGQHPVEAQLITLEVAAPPRSLEFCPGCPHRLTYYALNRAIEKLGFTKDEVITTGDIGCTIIGMNAPLDAGWTEVSMGASIGIAQGFKYAGIEQPVLAAMGDGTFFHNGIAGLLNAIQAGINLTLIILDNGRSAMTGMQPDAGTGRRTSGEPTLRADIEMIARGCGAQYVRKLNPYHLSEIIDVLQDAIQYPGVSVVIAEAPCSTPGKLIRGHRIQVDQEACLAGRGCDDRPCYSKVGCPSVLLSLDDVKPRISIDNATCVACGLCLQACPYGAIKPIQPAGETEERNSHEPFPTFQLRYILQE